MEQFKERWRITGVRLAILVLIGVGLYFLVIFVQQSLNLYRLTREVHKQEDRVAQLEQENERLRRLLESYTNEEGQRILVKENLPYKDPGEQVIIPVAEEGAGGAAPAGERAQAEPAEDLASLPAWRQWWRVIFTPPLVSN